MARTAGVLLHPTCLPGPYGIGDLGPGAERFLAWLADAEQTYWQTLPLHPVADSGSPYRCFSAFAGNPQLISPERLLAQQLVDEADCERLILPPERVDFAVVRRSKDSLLRRAWLRRPAEWPLDLRQRFEEFCDDPEIRNWLDDWILFAALRDRYRGQPWYRWPDPLRQRHDDALTNARQELESEIDYHRFTQFLFFDQWSALRCSGEHKGIRFLGDLAIYVAPDSADVWAHQDLFDLAVDGQPRTLAGVPPDYFSATGQLWGNPLYRWDRLAEQDFGWWTKRLAWSLRLADLVRLDHFRGFASYWEVAAGKETAVIGEWREGPGISFFRSVRAALGGELPLIAEDLGVITEDVRDLRKAAGLPGMRVLQFAFGDAPNEHLPHRLTRDTVVYTGTHDNDTARGWFEGASESQQQRILGYLGGTSREISWTFIRAALASVAETAIVPLQDILGLGSNARLNRPGETSDQWTWRLSELPHADLAEKLRKLTLLTERGRGDDRAS